MVSCAGRATGVALAALDCGSEAEGPANRTAHAQARRGVKLPGMNFECATKVGKSGGWHAGYTRAILRARSFICALCISWSCLSFWPALVLLNGAAEGTVEAEVSAAVDMR